MTTTTTTTTTVLKRHPIRGFLYGIVFGLGLAMIAVGQGWTALGTTPPILLFVVGLAVGTLWGTFGPAKAPKGSPPPEPVDVEALPEPSRFDDYEPSGPDLEAADAHADSADTGEADTGDTGEADTGDTDDD